MIVQPVLVVAAALFSLGIYGILVRRNAVMVLLSIELILNAVNINFIMFDAMLADTMMQGHGSQCKTLFLNLWHKINKAPKHNQTAQNQFDT